MRRKAIRSIRDLTVLVVAVGVLAGCSSEPVPAAPASSTTSPTPTAATTPTPTPSAAPSGPGLVPEGTAADNLPLFTLVMEQVWKTDAKSEGRAYIDALVDAGFDRDRMEVTRDRSTVGNPAESIQFSVLWERECLIGQVGPSTKRPTAVVLPELPEGGCLVGDTRPIDW